MPPPARHRLFTPSPSASTRALTFDDDGDGVGAGCVVDGADVPAGVASGGRTDLQLEGGHQQPEVVAARLVDTAVLTVPGHQQWCLTGRGRTTAATRPGHHDRVSDLLPTRTGQRQVTAGRYRPLIDFF